MDNMNKRPFPIEGISISKSFPRRDSSRTILFQDLSLSIEEGEILGLMGQSGLGKSTLGNILLNITPPDRGDVLWCGTKLKDLTRSRKKALRPLFQKIQQDPIGSFPANRTLRKLFKDFFCWGKHPLSPSKKIWDSTLEEGMEKASLSEKLLDRFPFQLSGGELQRFALLRAMLFNPLFLVADEPTSRLDPSVQAKVCHMLAREARTTGMAILFISHDQSLLEAVCSRILKLK
jgi:peptide/nickel transport system ATP-binding protein